MLQCFSTHIYHRFTRAIPKVSKIYSGNLTRNYCPDMLLKTYQRENKFDFSRHTNSGELKIKKNVILQWVRFEMTRCHTAMAMCLFKMLLVNILQIKLYPFVFASLTCTCLETTLLSFLTTDIPEITSPSSRTSTPIKIQH